MSTFLADEYLMWRLSLYHWDNPLIGTRSVVMAHPVISKHHGHDAVVIWTDNAETRMEELCWNDLNTAYPEEDFSLLPWNHGHTNFRPITPCCLTSACYVYILHVTCLYRYSLLQGMLQSPPGPFWPHCYLLFIYENWETTLIYL